MKFVRSLIAIVISLLLIGGGEYLFGDGIIFKIWIFIVAGFLMHYIIGQFKKGHY